jgi:hypothetical protein
MDSLQSLQKNVALKEISPLLVQAENHDQDKNEGGKEKLMSAQT